MLCVCEDFGPDRDYITLNIYEKNLSTKQSRINVF